MAFPTAGLEDDEAGSVLRCAVLREGAAERRAALVERAGERREPAAIEEAAPRAEHLRRVAGERGAAVARGQQVHVPLACEVERVAARAAQRAARARERLGADGAGEQRDAVGRDPVAHGRVTVTSLRMLSRDGGNARNWTPGIGTTVSGRIVSSVRSTSSRMQPSKGSDSTASSSRSPPNWPVRVEGTCA